MSFPYMGTKPQLTRAQRASRAKTTKIANAEPKRLSEARKPSKGVTYKTFATLEPVAVEEGFKPAVAFEDWV